MLKPALRHVENGLTCRACKEDILSFLDDHLENFGLLNRQNNLLLNVD